MNAKTTATAVVAAIAALFFATVAHSATAPKQVDPARFTFRVAATKVYLSSAGRVEERRPKPPQTPPQSRPICWGQFAEVLEFNDQPAQDGGSIEFNAAPNIRIWPALFSDDWCGEWQSKPRRPVDVIPDADTIRQRMQALRSEGRVLRELLKAAEVRDRLAARRVTTTASPPAPTGSESDRTPDPTG